MVVLYFVEAPFSQSVSNNAIITALNLSMLNDDEEQNDRTT